MGDEDDDRHEKESAPHTGFFKNLVLIQENVFDGNQWNVFVISPEEPQRDELTWCQLIRVDGERKNIDQYLRTGTERGSNIKPVMTKFG